MSQAGFLLRDRRFSWLFWTQFFTAFNDNFLKNAMVILIAYRANSVLGIPASQMVALAGGLFISPYFLFSATAGQLSDKHEKPRLIRIIKLIEIGIMVLATAGFLLQQFAFLLGVLFLMGLHSTFFGPLKYAILPQLLTDEELVTGNALVEMGSFLAILLGTIAGGVLVLLEPGGPWIVSGALLAISVLGWLTSLRIPHTAALAPELEVEWNPIPPTWKIIRFTASNRTVWLSVLGISWFWFFGAAFLSLFPPYTKDWLGGTESVVTLFLATFSMGIGAGSMVCERLSRKRLELGLVPIGSIGMSAFAVDLFCAGNPFEGAGLPVSVWGLLSGFGGLRILTDLLLISVFAGFFIVPLYTLIQERTEPAHRSRVLAGNNIINAIFMVIASGMIMSMMRAKLEIPQIFLAIALLNAAIAIYIYTLVPEFFYRFIAWVIANIMYRIKITGDEKIPHDGPALLVCNHVTFVDFLILLACVRRPVRFVMDHTYAPGWIGRFLVKRGKVIPIAQAKENPELLRRAMETVARELRDGEIVGIFPEGMLTRTGEMNKFRSGVERILAESPVPVIPMALQGLWGSVFSWKGGKAVFKRPRRFWSRVRLVIGDPLPPDQATAERLQQVVAGLRGPNA